MEFLASLAIKTLIGTSICGTITVGTIYKCDKTLLGFKDDTQTGGKDSVTKGEKGEEISTNGDKKSTINEGGISASLEKLGKVDAEIDKDEEKEGDGDAGSLLNPAGGEDMENVVIPDTEGSYDSDIPVTKQEINDAAQGQSSGTESSDPAKPYETEDGSGVPGDDAEDTDSREDSSTQGTSQTEQPDSK